jgi:hypothetical protein
LFFIVTDEGRLTLSGEVLMIFVYMIIQITYFYVGTKLSEKNSVIKNYLSVSFISFFGIVVWVVCYYLWKTSSSGFGVGTEINWLYYYVYTQHLLIINVFFPSIIRLNMSLTQIILFISAILPSLLFFFGITFKRGFIKEIKH